MTTSNTYEYAVSPSSQFPFCSIPFRLDISPNCPIGCRYCFSVARGGKRSKGKKLINTSWLRKKLEKNINSDFTERNIINDFFSHRLPIHIGGVSDPFGSTEQTPITIRVLKTFADYDYPVVLSTKNPIPLLNDDSLKTLHKLKYISIQISLPVPRDKYAAILEPNAPSVSSRLHAVKQLTKSGLHVVVRLQPIFLPFIDYIEKEYSFMLKDAGCNHLIIECLKMPVEKNRTSLYDALKKIKWDAVPYYKKAGALLVGRDWVLPPQIAWETIKPLTERFRKLGMTYGTTDHGLFHLGSQGSCCGITGRKGFEHLFDSNFSNILRNATTTDLKFSSVESNWLPSSSIKRYINSNSRLHGQNTLASHLRKFWNTPGNVNAPTAYLGVIYTGRKDEFNNCIYDTNGISSYFL